MDDSSICALILSTIKSAQGFMSILMSSTWFFQQAASSKLKIRLLFTSYLRFFTHVLPHFQTQRSFFILGHFSQECSLEFFNTALWRSVLTVY
jgi:hypothetical protein